MSTPVAAQTAMRPGLWEITNKVGGSGEIAAKMAALSPEQRKQMEKMLAQQGMGMSPGGEGITVRICVTPEMAARNDVPIQQPGDCKTDYVRTTGNTTRFAYVCSKPPSSGEGEVSQRSPESYSMKMNVTSQAQGKSQAMTVEAQGKWLATDCGSLKLLQR